MPAFACDDGKTWNVVVLYGRLIDSSSDSSGRETGKSRVHGGQFKQKIAKFTKGGLKSERRRFAF
jgi:hypothetical protein